MAPSSKKERKKAFLKGGDKGREGTAKTRKPAAGGIRGRVARTQAARGAPRERKAGKFFREVRSEMSKVTWPSREELVQSTIVVLIAVVIAGVYIALFDVLFSRLLGLFS